MSDSKEAKEGNAPDYQDIENENQMKEWDKAREVLKDYDDRLHELRKYGFSFLTGLLTVDVFASRILTKTVTESPEGITKTTETGSSVTAIPELFNLCIFIVTLLLIIALHLLDKNYRVYQQAANTRACVIERKLNLELSETITQRHKSGNIDLNVFFVYFLFITGTAGLGGAILYPKWNLIWWLIGCAVVTLVVTIFQSIILKVAFKNKDPKNKELTEDWIVSPLECNRAEEIRITLNNFRKTPFIEATKQFYKRIIKKFNKQDYLKYKTSILFKKGEVIWTIIDKYGTPVYEEKPEENITVYDNYVWGIPSKLKSNGIPEGIYRIKPRGYPTPLPVSIIVHNQPIK